MTYLLFGTAVMLSAVAAYYSIAGLAAIFAAAVIPIVVMGSVLEFAKLVVAAWLYRSWKSVPVLMRTYFTISLIILMSLTSMGIFGFLSKAHLDQAIPTGDVSSKVSILDERIKTEKDNVLAARTAIKQMDAQVDQTISRTDDAKGAERSLQIRRSQAKERNSLLNEISTAQNKISKLNEERAPIASELRKVEAEVGPIKYIAALIYGDAADQSVLEKAVRVVIIMIVIVFDPLAVLLLMAANTPILTRKEDENAPTKEANPESSTEAITSTKKSKPARKQNIHSNTRRETALEIQRETTNSEESTTDPMAEDKKSDRNKVVEYDSVGRRMTPEYD
ncbi:hypothetical protein UFOVP1666_177 [uncultured Caudovirales phage]|uniref:Uncharacterized protein n=1 Tax=uncultured Caudovirales phage TaxID=2100421 RepID=A0A6J5Q670_9CAUD|nr:hypothetical protein UFOVP867_132 [uncultured Caudovirales phage]CAB4170612.1 hypothetical protein UFOVP913_66 [uncultured Caudovirales phage]CAB4176998.1 hypothetical protein UFOVP993_119 [uncultured Caudovirales phage]CAB4223331.1 hypothetical protein UFOVP1666_177 [uncultured Caudovirales phage]